MRFWCLRPPQANADPSVISSMHKLSRRIAIALQHEERRCQYLTREAKLMLAVQDEIPNVTESEALLQLFKPFVLEVSNIRPAGQIRLILFCPRELQMNLKSSTEKDNFEGKPNAYVARRENMFYTPG